MFLSKRKVQELLAQERSKAEALLSQERERTKEYQEALAKDLKEALARSLATLESGQATKVVPFENPWLWMASGTYSAKRRPKSAVTTDTLRLFADSYDVLRSCIEQLKREVRAVPIKIVPRDTDDDSKRTQNDIEDAYWFFSRHGGLGGLNRSRRHFESEVFEDVLVIGAGAVYLRPNMVGGVHSAEPVQADTIVPLVDEHGWMHEDKAYVQIINGATIGTYSASDIYYDGLHAVTTQPYFKSRVEYVYRMAMAALKADEWNLNWLTDGNTPDQLIGAPPEWTPAQIKEYASYFDEMLAAKPENRNKALIVPAGFTSILKQSRKDADFQEFERWLMERTCSVMGVHPSSIGFSSQTYKYAQEHGSKRTSQFGANDLLEWRKDLYDYLLERNGFPHLEVRNIVEGEEEPLQRAQRLQVETGGRAWKSVNEARQEAGLRPIAEEGADSVIEPHTEVNPGRETDDKAENEQKKAKKQSPSESQPDEKENVRRWQRKALNQLKRNGVASCSFRSEAIPEYLADEILSGLAKAESADDVRAVFAPYLTRKQQ